MLYRCEGPYDRSILSSLYLGRIGIGFLSESEMKADHWLNVMAPTTDGRRLPRAVRETLALRSCTSHVLGRTASAVSSTHR